MTSTESRHHKCKPGYWLVNVAPLGKKPDWREQLEPPQQSELLFGYEPQVLLAKQYK